MKYVEIEFLHHYINLLASLSNREHWDSILMIFQAEIFIGYLGLLPGDIIIQGCLELLELLFNNTSTGLY